ncbi:phosphotransferase enzyme family protein [Aquibacillus albus]|uniref:Ser/Thr protein kinase RdoA (MazF antagonist) n=1 Tax=Aquibacillus albus TaxID=1168171 RepID=A0ABS2MWL8_9BACI|nr:phosphotransferase [Aquibacillus albus]MBM7570183.1 Ser/Thr protein kinase RdoA (MazF antagonist) [Aquibacillus albus]
MEGVQSQVEVANKVAERALACYDFSDSATLHLLNYSENTTYLVNDSQKQEKAILRINRVGYHHKQALEDELVWLHAIKQDTSIEVPAPIKGKNGSYIQTFLDEEQGQQQHFVMFEFLQGEEPDESDVSNLIFYFKKLGEITALLHKHSQTWTPSSRLERPVLDFDALIGKRPRWGRWQDGYGITPQLNQLFESVSDQIETAVMEFGKGPSRFGLIHADLRLANLLAIDDKIQVIDFDDCGYSWYLYDLAAALSFIEDKSYAPALVRSWLRGYRGVRPLSIKEEEMIPTFIMLRRLQLIAWIRSHFDLETAEKNWPHFTANTEELARNYLARNQLYKIQ